MTINVPLLFKHGIKSWIFATFDYSSYSNAGTRWCCDNRGRRGDLAEKDPVAQRRDIPTLGNQCFGMMQPTAFSNFSLCLARSCVAFMPAGCGFVRRYCAKSHGWSALLLLKHIFLGNPTASQRKIGTLGAWRPGSWRARHAGSCDELMWKVGNCYKCTKFHDTCTKRIKTCLSLLELFDHLVVLFRHISAMCRPPKWCRVESRRARQSWV